MNLNVLSKDLDKYLELSKENFLHLLDSEFQKIKRKQAAATGVNSGNTIINLQVQARACLSEHLDYIRIAFSDLYDGTNIKIYTKCNVNKIHNQYKNHLNLVTKDTYSKLEDEMSGLNVPKKDILPETKTNIQTTQTILLLRLRTSLLAARSKSWHSNRIILLLYSVIPTLVGVFAGYLLSYIK